MNQILYSVGQSITLAELTKVREDYTDYYINEGTHGLGQIKSVSYDSTCKLFALLNNDEVEEDINKARKIPIFTVDVLMRFLIDKLKYKNHQELISKLNHNTTKSLKELLFDFACIALKPSL